MTTTDPQEYLDDDYPQDDDLLAADARTRPGRLTLVLAAAIVLTGVFAAGVLTQKHVGGSTTAAAGAARTGVPGGFPGGLPGGEGGFPRSGAGASSTPVVVGTVVKVSGTTVTVRNFAGKQVTVTVPKGASVTTSGSVSDLSKGTTVSVAGSKASDGSVTASSVTAQKTATRK